MPFTTSHPAIILPLLKFSNKWVSSTGLIIGSMTPDFEYFIRMKLQSLYSHSFLGILWFNLPLAIILSFIFHNFVRNALIDNLPGGLYGKLLPYKDFNWNVHFKRNVRIIIFSCLIGSFTHVLWDSFTHSEALFVQNIEFLRAKIDFLLFEIPLYRIIQHGSTIIGGIFVINYINKMPSFSNSYQKFNWIYWVPVFITSVCIISYKISNGLHVQQHSNLIVASISSMLISLTFISFLFKKIKS